ncbi:hypothetical protein [uncultured Tateyamaria sp.]|uniref:hypothetical protein n=1 Tax=Tateyamaria sp. 1078 TaxID=3417464 RepID=UPI00263063CA|nr:hypothetical protein [uncultured Tateyamaria sp.]
MLKFLLKSLALGAAFVMPVAAAASVATPPASFQGQWWTHPAGCEYSRAGRPGETVWFLIVNTAKPGCPTYIATKTWGDVYKAQGPKM